MFYKKRIEELERTVDELTKSLSHMGGWTGTNRCRIADLFEYLDVMYVTELEGKRLVKREKNILEQAKERLEEVT